MFSRAIFCKNLSPLPDEVFSVFVGGLIAFLDGLILCRIRFVCSLYVAFAFLSCRRSLQEQYGSFLSSVNLLCKNWCPCRLYSVFPYVFFTRPSPSFAALRFIRRKGLSFLNFIVAVCIADNDASLFLPCFLSFFASARFHAATPQRYDLYIYLYLLHINKTCDIITVVKIKEKKVNNEKKNLSQFPAYGRRGNEIHSGSV